MRNEECLNVTFLSSVLKKHPDQRFTLNGLIEDPFCINESAIRSYLVSCERIAEEWAWDRTPTYAIGMHKGGLGVGKWHFLSTSAKCQELPSPWYLHANGFAA